MTTLLIDRGNTCLKWQLLENAKLIQRGVADKHDDMAAVFTDVDSRKVSSVWVSSVAGEGFQQSLNQWLSRNHTPPATFISSESSAFGLVNAYAKPTQLGVDRWLAMLAARHNYQGLLCVVDCGTACTLDVITEGGQHLGGYIVPGISLMAKSLLSNTQRITVGEHDADEFLGQNTSQAVMLGVQQSLKSFIQQTLLEIEASHNMPVKLILTGGDSSDLAADLNIPSYREPDLIFKGLQLYVEQAL